MCNSEKVNVTLRLSKSEIQVLDNEWRGNLSYKSRADYIRNKLGLTPSVEGKE